MPSVIGLLEAREKETREEVARLRAALEEAERALQRLVDARVTVTEVLTGEPAVAPKSALKGPVAGSTVPHRVSGDAGEEQGADACHDPRGGCPLRPVDAAPPPPGRSFALLAYPCAYAVRCGALPREP
ncbi:hypothetical protein [Streptomyces sp. NPDC047043]|uniref:hypothetical protein n=1 Tax=Streptomyces sp. NPDC047043 TaxID=3154497 RepID=UPI0033FE0A9C